jgi:hypothetical protein
MSYSAIMYACCAVKNKEIDPEKTPREKANSRSFKIIKRKNTNKIRERP